MLLDDRVSRVMSARARASDGLPELPTFELAGPRDRIFFDPAKLRVGIVTCGGLCPGINNVVRGLVLELTHAYGVETIFGFRYGFEGLVARLGHEPILLRPDMVASIHQQGGTILGTSRGGRDPQGEMVDRLQALGIGVLFVIGGDGTLRGATKLVAEVERRGLPISVVGIPKTIDNDIHFIDRSVGFESAAAAAADAIRSAPTSRPPAWRATASASSSCWAGTRGSSPATPRWPAPTRTSSSSPRCRCTSAGAGFLHATWNGASSSARTPSSWWPKGPASSCAPTRPRSPGAARRRWPTPAATPSSRTSAWCCAIRILKHFGARGIDHPTLKYIRSELSDSQRPGLAVRQRLLLEHGAQRRPRRAGRQHRECWRRPLKHGRFVHVPFHA